MIVDSLPENVVGEILTYLLLDERIRTLMTCRSLLRLRPSLDRHVAKLELYHQSHLDIVCKMDLTNMCNVVELSLGKWATNEILFTLGADGTLLPRLTKVDMLASAQVTDAGLRALSIGGLRRLKYLDLTFCHKTTYEGTFCLRDAFPEIIIRRQPVWMDGGFVTPFENDGTHTYWCDGSFLFERDQQSCGWIRTLYTWSSQNHVGDKLQYVNFEPPQGWPDWSRYCYRPGVSLLKLENDLQQDGSRHVLVGQRLHGMRPPEDYPKPEHEGIVPLHGRRYFDRSGNLLPEEHNIQDQRVMISRMMVIPLQSPMPPVEVVQRNRVFCQELERLEKSGLHLDEAEEYLALALHRD
jgi:hypothetical protein